MPRAQCRDGVYERAVCRERMSCQRVCERVVCRERMRSQRVSERAVLRARIVLRTRDVPQARIAVRCMRAA